MRKLLQTCSVVIILFLTGCQGCEPVDNLGSGFSVTYVDDPNFRGVYYDRQNVNGKFSVWSVKYDDSLILVSGYRLPPNRNTPDTTELLHYGISKPKYIRNPDQIKSEGYLGLLSDKQYDQLGQLLKNPKTIEW